MLPKCLPCPTRWVSWIYSKWAKKYTVQQSTYNERPAIPMGFPRTDRQASAWALPMFENRWAHTRGSLHPQNQLQEKSPCRKQNPIAKKAKSLCLINWKKWVWSVTHFKLAMPLNEFLKNKFLPEFWKLKRLTYDNKKDTFWDDIVFLASFSRHNIWAVMLVLSIKKEKKHIDFL